MTIATCAKMFPWPKYTLNIAGLIAARFLPLIFIFAFLSTTVRLTSTPRHAQAERRWKLQRAKVTRHALPSHMYLERTLEVLQ